MKRWIPGYFSAVRIRRGRREKMICPPKSTITLPSNAWKESGVWYQDDTKEEAREEKIVHGLVWCFQNYTRLYMPLLKAFTTPKFDSSPLKRLPFQVFLPSFFRGRTVKLREVYLEVLTAAFLTLASAQFCDRVSKWKMDGWSDVKKISAEKHNASKTHDGSMVMVYSPTYTIKNQPFM